MRSSIVFVVPLVLAFLGGPAIAADTGVWRYVDDSGKVVYSNVKIKGKKGERVDIMEYPDPPLASGQGFASVPGMPNGASIPADVANALGLQPGGRKAAPGSAVDRPPLPPSGLPPLPGQATFPAVPIPPQLREQAARVAAGEPAPPRSAAEPAAAWARPVDDSAQKAPSWAKPSVQRQERPPGWASDPFSSNQPQ